MTDLLFFCPEKVAIVDISGIITTNLGKAATRTRITGRKKTNTSLQNMPFSLTGEGHFLWSQHFPVYLFYVFYIQRLMFKLMVFISGGCQSAPVVFRL